MDDLEYSLPVAWLVEFVEALNEALDFRRVEVTFIYSEGGMAPYDDLDLPGRTMLTSEGTVNRSTHFLKVNDKYRLITPIEAERLQDFPDNWTAKKKLADGSIVEVYDKMRMFFMGNALVTEIVKEIANFIRKIEK